MRDKPNECLYRKLNVTFSITTVNRDFIQSERENRRCNGCRDRRKRVHDYIW